MKEFGEGEDILLLLPGMMCDHRLWDEQIKHFSKEYKIYVPDMSQHRSLEALGREILDNLPAAKLVVAGLSMGGILAMELLRLSPERFEAVILLDTNHLSEMQARRELRATEIADAENGGLRDIIVKTMKPAYLVPGRHYHPELSETILKMAMEQGVACFVNQSLALRDRPDYTEVIQNISCPVLIAYGEKDVMCPPSRHNEMFALLSEETRKLSSLVEIKGCGHLPTMEQPEEINAIMRNWLAKTLH